MKEPEKSLYIKVIEIARRYPRGFSSSDIIDNTELNLEEWEKNTIMRHFKEACERFNWEDNTKGETIFLFIHGDHSKPNSIENKYILTFNAEFTFMDFLELKFARENAKEARRISMFAIEISLVTLLISALIPFIIAFFLTQDVRVINFP